MNTKISFQHQRLYYLKLHFFRVIFCVWLPLFFYASSAYSIHFSDSYLAEIQQKYGEYPKRRLVAWEKLIIENKNAPEKKKLEEINNFFNLLDYRTDMAHWGVKDYWATPLEFVVSGAGICVDYAVAKYFTLLELGVPDDKLLLEYVQLNAPDSNFDQAHMVLLYYEKPDSVPLVLDSYNKEILPGDQRKDLIPVYGFNGKGLWQAKELSKGNQIGKATDLKRWSS